MDYLLQIKYQRLTKINKVSNVLNFYLLMLLTVTVIGARYDNNEGIESIPPIADNIQVIGNNYCLYLISKN